jgi:hypothetical protein
MRGGQRDDASLDNKHAFQHHRDYESEMLMRCPVCDGSGLHHYGAAVSPLPSILPCPECGGCGVAHCCDGLQACCDIEGDRRAEAHRGAQVPAAPAKPAD